MTAQRALLVGVLLALAAGLTGCSSSPWKSEFAGSRAPALADDAPVQVREVSWERLQTGLKELEQAEAASDVSPADWSPERKAQAKSALLRTLQVQDDPEKVEIIGRSSFRGTRLLRPESGGQAELVEVARSLGADRVIWSRRLLGKADTIVQEPVTTYYWGGGGWGRRGVFSQTATSWVPVRVQADEYAYVAYFLRDVGG